MPLARAEWRDGAGAALVGLVSAAALLAACGGATSASKTTASTVGQTAPSTCTVSAQRPPGDTIEANFPIALAFAPDGRLFYAERSGTVRVYQDGTARTFASVSTVTSEPGGGYSERGLLGIAISPTFTEDHFVFAFYRALIATIST